MTALAEFEKIEAVGVWRADASAQRRDVVVALGDATLTILDMQDRPLAHWSIPAVARANPGVMPAVFHPDGDPEEILEFGNDSDVMVEAIEKLRKAVDRKRPKPGRVRLTSFLFIVIAILVLGIFWMPSAVLHQTLAVLPEVKQREIGEAIASSAERYTGRACATPEADQALDRLANRILPVKEARIRVVPDGVVEAIVLPGQLFLVGRPLVEDYESPEVLAGYLLSEQVRAGFRTSILDVLTHAGVWNNIRLLTTGALPQSAIDSYADTLLFAAPERPDNTQLLPAFEAAGISSRPFALALDITGETTLELIEADPMATSTRAPLISDGAWVALQGVCES